MTQVVPQWQIAQTFESVADASVQPLRALLLGPAYAVRRYEAQKAAVALGQYAGVVKAVQWPGRSAGEIVDQAFTRVWFENAVMRYAEITDAGTQVVSGRPNRIRNASVNWASNPGYPRDARIPTDLRVGDVLRVSLGATKVFSPVTALLADTVAAVIGVPADGADNVATAAGASAVTAGGSNAGTAVSSVAGLSNPTNYNGAVSGQMSETYTVTVLVAGADTQGNAGSWASLQLQVTSQSGTEATQVVTGVVSGTPFAIGTRGARLTLSHGASGNDFTVGDTFSVTVSQSYTEPVLATGGSYTGSRNTTYVVRVTRGGGIGVGVAAADRAQITVTTTTEASANGVDSGGPYSVTTAIPTLLGNLGIALTFTGTTLVVGDQWTLSATAATAGAVHGIELADNLPSGFAGQDLGVELAVPGTVEVSRNRIGYAPLVNWSGSATELTLAAGILVQNDRVPGADLPVLKADGYVTYRALQTSLANTVNDVTSEADALSLYGAEDADGGLSYAIRRALSNANGTTLKVLAVGADTLAGYQAAMATLTEREDFYRIVPLTHDEAIIDACISVALQRSGQEVGRWATVMAALAIRPTVKLVGGADVVASVQQDPEASGASFTIVEDLAGTFMDQGVRPGDEARLGYTSDGFGGVAYSSYVVDAVLSNQRLRLVAGPSGAVTPAAKYEIWRTLTVAEQAADFGKRAQARSNRRVTIIFPANPGRVGTRVPSYYLAASVAALRCSVAPHQGLTNASLADWDDLREASETFGAQLDVLANYGVYIVTQTPAGQVYIRKQLTTDLSDTKHAEDSATVNYDSISYYFKNLLAGTTGRTNVVDSNLQLIEAKCKGGISELKTTGATTELGGQITDGKVDYVRAHATQLDKVVAKITVQLPIPLNNGELTLVA